ncbi:hypothetical protein HBA55_36500 [Pseudomaricurvus alkylphenolicus]|uniref:hypothetical protein n=1 Tax=Pseudomaricurvus alkylphenolicus TaxID=1306991 RepID=UPI001420D796|nr:hypothetical protein [Pseudomaricurvus alkylphenolicus]NIB45137.1 hypothetical protein [Pseudomaricurvus alkylphenolicus]
MNSTEKVNIKTWCILAFAVFMVRPIGDKLSAFLDFLPSSLDLETLVTINTTVWFVEALVGYSIAGILFGVCASITLGHKGIQYAKWLPLAFFGAYCINAFINLFSAGRASNFSVLNLLGLLLTTGTGYAYLVVSPLSSYAAMWFLESKNGESDRAIPIGFLDWLKLAFK